MQALFDLYNGIKNAPDLQKRTVGYTDILTNIGKQFREIPKSEIEFSPGLLLEAAIVSNGKLLTSINNFAKELKIQIDSIRER